MGTLLQDVRYGARMLLKHPGFTAIAVTALALGIGANSAIFSVVNAVLLRPLPYQNPEGLVMVWGNFQRLGMTKLGVSAPEFFDYKNQSDVFADMAAFQTATFNLTGGDEPQRIGAARVSSGLFPLLGVSPLVGRTLLAEEDQRGRERVVVLSHHLWQTRFNSDPGLIGKGIVLDGDGYTVVGVMPREFQFPFGKTEDAERAEAWVPAAFSAEELQDRGRYFFRMIARLKPGVTLEQARAEMSAIGRRLEEQYPRTYRGPKGEDGGWQVTVTTLRDEIVGGARLLLFVLLGVVGFVLLISCANVSNLLLARASARRREVAIRMALGATRGRLFRQFLTESIMLALLGGSVGLLLAMWGMDMLVAASPREIPRLGEAGLDARVLGFTFVVALLTGVLFGLAPALRVSRGDLNESLKESVKGGTTGFRRQRSRSLLVVSEIALTLVLLIGAGLMIKSFARLLNVDPGFDAANVLTMQVSLPSARYAEPSEKARFYEQLLARVKALPGIEAASVTTALPLTGETFGGPFSIEGRPLDMTGKPPHAHIRTTAPGYFHVMSIPFIAGRDFSDADTNESIPVVVINETFARGFFAGGDPIGKRIKIGAPASPRPWMQIAGIIRDVKSDGLDAEPLPEMYVPYAQNISPAMTLVARTANDPAGSVAAVRRAVQETDKEQPVYNVGTMKQLLARSIAQRRFNMIMLGVFALIALLLAASGIFGLIAYTVAQRTHEIGIRMALGARSVDVLKLIVREAMLLALAGVAVGLLGAFMATRVLAGLLYGVSATDPVTFACVACVLFFVALLASYIPARKATRIDPNVALRHE
ncbi:MAG: ABC transporter permease [Pyrinomonadaceae bacterium]